MSPLVSHPDPPTPAGWESQLLETGFLGIFLCPLWTLSRLPKHTPTSQIVLWGFRWLIFRIMLGAVGGAFMLMYLGMISSGHTW